MKKIIFLLAFFLGSLLSAAQQNVVNVSFLGLPLYSNRNRLNSSSIIDFNNHSLIFMSDQKDWFCYTENSTNREKCEYLNFVMHVVRVGEREFAVAYTAFESSKKKSDGYPDIGFKKDDDRFYNIEFKDTEIIVGAGSYIKNGKKYKRENYQTYSLNDVYSLLRSKNTIILLDQEGFKNKINSLIIGIETNFPSFTNQNYGYIGRSGGTYSSSASSSENYVNQNSGTSRNQISETPSFNISNEDYDTEIEAYCLGIGKSTKNNSNYTTTFKASLCRVNNNVVRNVTVVFEDTDIDINYNTKQKLFFTPIGDISYAKYNSKNRTLYIDLAPRGTVFKNAPAGYILPITSKNINETAVKIADKDLIEVYGSTSGISTNGGYGSNGNYGKKGPRSSYSGGDNVTLTGTLRRFSEVKKVGVLSGQRIDFYVLELPNSITVDNMSAKQIQLNIINNDGRYTRYVNRKVTISGSLRVPDTLNWQRDIVLDNPSLQ